MTLRRPNTGVSQGHLRVAAGSAHPETANPEPARGPPDGPSIASWRPSRLRACESGTSVRARVRRWSCSTAPTRTAASGGGSSRTCRTNSRFSPGMRRGAAARTIRHWTSQERIWATPWQDSCGKRCPVRRTSSGCPWAPALRSSSTGRTPRFRRRCCWFRRMPAGRDPCRRRKWSAATPRSSPNSSSRRSNSSPCGCPPCSRNTLIQRLCRKPAPSWPTSIRAACGHCLNANAHADYRDVLPTIVVPTLLLYGTEDVRAPQSVAREMNRRIPGSTLVMIPDVGHMAPVEAPAAFNAAVRRFLHGLSAG